jgi:hypothetical protein
MGSLLPRQRTVPGIFRGLPQVAFFRFFDLHALPRRVHRSTSDPGEGS